MKNLYDKWIEAKAAEKFAQDTRREIEDLILKDDPDTAGYKVLITTRINRTINGDLLQELAEENGLTDHLSSLFSWKASINAKEWNKASEKITKPLEDAITSKEGRASFKIERIEEEK